MLRQTIIECKSPDVICLSETHLIDANIVQIDRYSWFGFNRRLRNVRAPKGSGRVGILVNSNVLHNFVISIIDKQVDGILGLLFSHKITDVQIVIFACYLSPSTSVWGRDADSFFSHLLGQIYTCSDYDHIVICGDFNARIGNNTESIADVDSLSERHSIDNVRAGHCEAFMDFLRDSKT